MNRFGRRRARVQALGRGESAGGVVGQQRRHLQRHPAVHAVGAVVDRAEQIGGPREILERQLEEQRLAGLALVQLFADRGVVGAAVLDRVVEDRRIRGEPGDRKLVDVALERAAVEQVARDVVEPETLAQVVEQLGGFHRCHLRRIWTDCRPASSADRSIVEQIADALDGEVGGRICGDVFGSCA